MKNQLTYYSGRALITASAMMAITMVMHPAGGSFDHLQHISTMIIITHSLAMLSIPIALFGFWGLTKRLSANDPLAIVTFITVCIGMFAVLMAAAFNGLALPLFIGKFHNPPPEIRNALTLLLSYNNALNHSFDYIFIAGIVIAITLWSVIIIKTRILPASVGYFGVVTCILVIGGMAAGFMFVNLTGFRVFIAGLVVWMAVIGMTLNKHTPTAAEV